MRVLLGVAFAAFLLAGCDENRVYDRNTDFDARQWLVSEKPVFDFEIADTASYDLYCNLRNSLSYPYARIFMTWYLRDSTGSQLEKKLISTMLFDEKTGEPFGDTGLGDIYDHTIALKTNYRFPGPGKYSVSFEQFMRTDTLAGILAVGLRIEKRVPEKK